MAPHRDILTRRILLILMAGVSLGLTRSPRRYFYILKMFRREWEALGASDTVALKAVNYLKARNLVHIRKRTDGHWYPELTRKGMEKAALCQTEDLEIKRPERWDGKWRIVMFDVPESRKKGRDALQRTLKNLGFYQFQKSVFIHPFECRQEINFIADFFAVKPYIKFAVLESLEGAEFLKKRFELR